MRTASASRIRSATVKRNDKNRIAQTGVGEAISVEYLTERAAARYVGLSVRTLQRMRTRGTGPLFYRLGPKRIAYRRADIDAWASQGHFRSTSDVHPQAIAVAAN